MSDGFQRLWLSEKHARLGAERTCGMLSAEVRTQAARADRAERSLQDAWTYHRELLRMSSPKPTPDGQ